MAARTAATDHLTLEISGERSESAALTCWTATLENEMAKTERIEVRIPAETMAELQAVANSAGLKPEQVMALTLAVDMRRWNRESGVRAERDAAIDTLRHLASAKKGADVRKMAALKVAELQGVAVPSNMG